MLVRRASPTASSLPAQDALQRESIDYKFQRMQGLALGIVKYLYYPDSDMNQSTNMKNDPEGGRCLQAVVEIIQYPKWWKSGSTDTSFNVLVDLPSFSGGFDTYEEDIPRSLEMEPQWMKGQNAANLDCDYVYVGFLGGQVNRPVFAGFAAHYRGNPDRARIADGARKYYRKNGARFKVTSTGDHVVDLVEANRLITVPDLGTFDPTMLGVRNGLGTTYQNQVTGGNNTIYLKQGSTVDIVFENENTAVSGQDRPANTRYLEVTRLKISNSGGEAILEVPSNKLRLKSPVLVTVEAPEVKLGGDSAVLGVARATDPVQGNAGPFALSAAIVSPPASTVVKSM